MKVVANFFLLIRALFIYFLIGLLFVFTIIPAMILLVVLPEHFCHQNRALFWLLDVFYKGAVGCTLVPVSITGKGNLPKKPAIFVANHQSSLDILLLGSLMNGYPHLWYALSYYAKFPVLGFFIRRLGMPLDRSKPMSAGRSLMRGIEMIQGKRRHIAIFPEGGRFNDGKVHDFLRGFAIIARKTGRPVVPVLMPYNGTVYPPTGFCVYRHPLVVVIGEPFVMGENETDADFVQRVHSWFEDENAKFKG